VYSQGVAEHKLHHIAEELQVEYNGIIEVVIDQGDINGDGNRIFQIEVHSAVALAPSDFIL
jgi:hypothetical protein